MPNVNDVIAPIEIMQQGIFNPNLAVVDDIFEMEARLVGAVRKVRNVVNPPEQMIWQAAPVEYQPVSKDPMKLCDYLGRFDKGLFGYELEVEGDNLPQRVDGWKIAKDGSLRGESAEYVLNTPSSFEEIVQSFKLLVSKLTKPATKLSFSYRTSTHVHVNMLHFTKEQIQAFFYLSHLVEDILVHYCAPIRKGNRFCLRTKDAEWKIDSFKAWLSKKGYPALSQDMLKYSAINIATLSHYGSIEFRSLHGTVDEAVVTPWLNVLKNIHDIATIVPIKEMVDTVKKSPMDIINVVFKDFLPVFQYTGMEGDVVEAYERLIEIPYVKVVT